jgi:hypothetical protein
MKGLEVLLPLVIAAALVVKSLEFLWWQKSLA